MSKISLRLKNITSSAKPSWLAVQLPVLGMLYVILGTILMLTMTDYFIVTVGGLLGLITTLALFVSYLEE